MREKTIYMLSILVLLLVSLLTACSKQEDAQTQKQPPAPSKDPVISEISQPSGVESTVQATEQPTPEPVQANTAQEKTESPLEIQQAPGQTAEKTPVVDQTKLALARKSGCLSCHAVDKKIVGPAWRDVAKRYKDIPDAKTPRFPREGAVTGQKQSALQQCRPIPPGSVMKTSRNWLSLFYLWNRAKYIAVL